MSSLNGWSVLDILRFTTILYSESYVTKTKPILEF